MTIKFADNTLKDDCLSDDRFTDLIIANLTKNQKVIKDNQIKKWKNREVDG